MKLQNKIFHLLPIKTKIYLVFKENKMKVKFYKLKPFMWELIENTNKHKGMAVNNLNKKLNKKNPFDYKIEIILNCFSAMYIAKRRHEETNYDKFRKAFKGLGKKDYHYKVRSKFN